MFANTKRRDLSRYQRHILFAPHFCATRLAPQASSLTHHCFTISAKRLGALGLKDIHRLLIRQPTEPGLAIFRVVYRLLRLLAVGGHRLQQARPVGIEGIRKLATDRGRGTGGNAAGVDRQGNRAMMRMGGHDDIARCRIVRTIDQHARAVLAPVPAPVLPATAASAASSATRWFTAGSSVATTTSRAPARSPDAYARRSIVTGSDASSSATAGAMTVTSAPASSSAAARRRATFPPPTITQRQPHTFSMTGRSAIAPQCSGFDVQKGRPGEFSRTSAT